MVKAMVIALLWWLAFGVGRWDGESGARGTATLARPRPTDPARLARALATTRANGPRTCAARLALVLSST